MSDPTSPTAPDVLAGDDIDDVVDRLRESADEADGRADGRARNDPDDICDVCDAVERLTAELAEARATLARLRAPAADVAAIGARAAAAKHAARVHGYCRDCGAVDPAEETHGGFTFHAGCPRPNAFTGGADAIGTTHGIIAHADVLALIDDTTTLLALLAAAREGHAAQVAGARAAALREAEDACRARATKHRETTERWRAKGDHSEARACGHDAAEADACAAAVAALGAKGGA